MVMPYLFIPLLISAALLGVYGNNGEAFLTTLAALAMFLLFTAEERVPGLFNKDGENQTHQEESAVDVKNISEITGAELIEKFKVWLAFQPSCDLDDYYWNPTTKRCERFDDLLPGCNKLSSEPAQRSKRYQEAQSE